MLSSCYCVGSGVVIDVKRGRDVVMPEHSNVLGSYLGSTGAATRKVDGYKLPDGDDRGSNGN